MRISKANPKNVCVKPKSIRACMYETKVHGCSNTSCTYCIDKSKLSLDGLAVINKIMEVK